VLSYAVALRTREIGVRTALGAARGDIAWLILSQGAGIVGTGVVVGLATSLVVAGSLSKLLYGVSSHDAATFVGAPLIVVLIAAVACAVPARRAARIDPLTALRS
jgi:putative ABC transport system permease protein